MPYLTIYCKMFKRLQNMRSPRKRQGSVPQRGKAKKSLFDSDNTDADGTTHSFDSDCTIPLESHDDLSDDNQSAKCFSPERSSTPCSSKPVASKPRPRNDDKLIKSNISSVMPSTSGSSSSLVKSNDNAEVDSLKVQARHYKTLSAMYKKKNSNPNQSDVAQAIDELCRIVGGTNTKYLLETKERWSDFSKKVQFFGIWKKAMTPPLPLDVHGADFMIGVLSALPSLFPSPAVPPKKMANASESLIHILKSIRLWPGAVAAECTEDQTLWRVLRQLPGECVEVCVGALRLERLLD
uniref:Uncharacterized protein n=1 Tax=Knipowitschia caucasica TaxID=637954 RepID=A0AAV2MP31_KNICA